MTQTQERYRIRYSGDWWAVLVCGLWAVAVGGGGLIFGEKPRIVGIVMLSVGLSVALVAALVAVVEVLVERRRAGTQGKREFRALVQEELELTALESLDAQLAVAYQTHAQVLERLTPEVRAALGYPDPEPVKTSSDGYWPVSDPKPYAQVWREGKARDKARDRQRSGQAKAREVYPTLAQYGFNRWGESVPIPATGPTDAEATRTWNVWLAQVECATEGHDLIEITTMAGPVRHVCGRCAAQL